MVFHPLNTAYTDEELHFFLQDAAPAMLVCDSNRSEALQALCQSVGTPYLYTLDADGGGTLVQGAQQCSVRFDTAATNAADLAALVYSSGTTGRPKGIMLSHGNLVENISVLVDYWGFGEDDCLLHALPIFHVHGLFVAIGCVLMSGGSLRWLHEFDVKTVMQNLPYSTVMMGVPTYYTRLLVERDFNAQHCVRTRLFVSGSAPLLADTFVEFEQRTGHRRQCAVRTRRHNDLIWVNLQAMSGAFEGCDFLTQFPQAARVNIGSMAILNGPDRGFFDGLWRIKIWLTNAEINNAYTSRFDSVGQQTHADNDGTAC